MKRNTFLWVVAGAGLLLATIAIPSTAFLFGGETDPNGWGGTLVSDGSAAVQLGTIEPGTDEAGDPLVFENARFQINSVALRDCRMGGISLTGIEAGSTIISAYLYWQWACLDEPVAGVHDAIRFVRVFPPPRVGSGDTIGTLVGTGTNPCWCGPDYSNYNYRADVTSVIAADTGGVYGVISIGGAAGSVDYADPWAGVTDPSCERTPEPLLNGAVLVVVYESECAPNGTVAIYDAGLAGTMFTPVPGLAVTLSHPVAGDTESRWALAAGDGQVGFGYEPLPSFATETTSINATQIAGPGTDYNDSHWNGSLGKPLPQVYESAGQDVTGLIAAGATTTDVTFAGTGVGLADCVVPTAMVLFTR